MYRFLFRPKWLLRHVLVVVLAVVMVSLGFWQLRRLQEKQDTNALVTERIDLLIEPVADLLDTGDDGARAVFADFRFRAASASGSYLVDEEALVRSRSLGGRPGFWVLTPLELESGSVLVVNRGWIPFEERTDGSDIEFETPAGEVIVEGFLRRGVGGAREAGDERITIDHVDVEWFDGRLEGAVYPLYLDLAVQTPSQEGRFPTLLDPPDLDEGPHLGYAAQWFIFSAIAVIGYPIMLHRVAHGPPPAAREPEFVGDDPDAAG